MNGILWEAQWTPFFHKASPSCPEGSVQIDLGSEIELPPITSYQVWDYPTGKWSLPERHVLIPWNTEMWLDITKLNLVHNRG